MRIRAVLTATLAVALLAATLSALFAPNASAQGVPPPKVFWTIFGTTENGVLKFIPDRLIVPQVPTIVNVTFVNADPGPGVQHTFTIRSTAANAPDPLLVNTGLISPGQQAFVEFALTPPQNENRILAGTRNETAEVEGGFIKFYCIPHEAARMIGHVVVGGVQGQAEPGEKGVFLRAYWIGLLGMAGTLVLVVVSYFVIKGSSRHYRDHHEHIRRGGP